MIFLETVFPFHDNTPKQTQQIHPSGMFDYDILVVDPTSSATCQDSECVSSSQDCEDCVNDSPKVSCVIIPSPVRKSSRSSRPPV